MPDQFSPLNALATGMPSANAKRQQQQQATTALQLQQAVRAAGQPTAQGSAAPGVPTPNTAQTLGAAAATQQGQQAVDAAKSNVAQQSQVGQQAVQQQADQVKNKIAALSQGQQVTQLSDEQKLSQLSAQAKQEMFDSRLHFQRDEAGRTAMNERQLSDYAVLHARDAQQFQNYAQTASQLHDREMELMQAASRKIDAELQAHSALGEQQQNQALKAQLVQAKYDADQAAARAAAKRKNNSTMWQAGGAVVGTVAGAVIGGYVTGGAGTTAGAAAGGAIGSGLGSAIGGAIGSANGG